MSPGRPICLVLRAIALLDIMSACLSVMATPIPLPLPLMAIDYSSSPGLVSVNRSTSQIASGKSSSLRQLRPSTRSDERSSSDDSLEELYQYFNAAQRNGDDISTLAAQSSNVNDNDIDYQQQYASALSSYSNNMSGFQAAFAKASGSDKGLANYVPQNDIETLLKKVVNLHKDVLSATYEAVKNLPILGPILGPFVYDVKCLVDELLDAIEDLSDAIVNVLQPLLQSLFPSLITAACNKTINLLGLCV